MLSFPSRLLLALAGVAMVIAAGYGLAIGERSGVALLLGVAVAALVAGFAILGTGVRDFAPIVPLDAPPPERAATTPGPAATGSVWPMLAAGSLGLLAVSVVVNRGFVYFAVILIGVTALGWFGRAWLDHPLSTRRVTERLSNRLVAPVLTPIGALLLAMLVAISISRVLLAVSEGLARLVALIVATLIVAAFFVIAARPKLRSSAMAGLAAVAAVTTVGAGIAGASNGERTFEHKGEGPDVIKVIAKGTTFLEKDLNANGQAGKELQIRFDNRDATIYHNVALYRDGGAKPMPVFNGQGIPGPKKITYRVTVPAGTYRFQCDFHANMQGAFVVT